MFWCSQVAWVGMPRLAVDLHICAGADSDTLTLPHHSAALCVCV